MVEAGEKVETLFVEDEQQAYSEVTSGACQEGAIVGYDLAEAKGRAPPFGI